MILLVRADEPVAGGESRAGPLGWDGVCRHVDLGQKGGPALFSSRPVDVLEEAGANAPATQIRWDIDVDLGTMWVLLRLQVHHRSAHQRVADEGSVCRPLSWFLSMARGSLMCSRIAEAFGL